MTLRQEIERHLSPGEPTPSAAIVMLDAVAARSAAQKPYRNVPKDRALKLDEIRAFLQVHHASGVNPGRQ